MITLWGMNSGPLHVMVLQYALVGSVGQTIECRFFGASFQNRKSSIYLFEPNAYSKMCVRVCVTILMVVCLR